MTYTITAWKDGSPKEEVDAKTKREATKIANQMIAGKRGYTCDSVDICEYTEEGYLHTKTCYTLWNGVWNKSVNHIGEDEGYLVGC